MAKIEIVWSPKSLGNLEEIAEFISLNSPLYAPIFVQKKVSSVERLIDFPLSGRIVPEFNIESIREVIFHNYRIVYRINIEQIEIVLVTHGSRIIN
ncbi:MAG: type II toxin-antitoxin system RelE/ParE family toxin [Ignavibacteria bacterium]|nr:type II toxin-antitoxin system RelE/ParE family toxin [Ignavibacteria bacterium]